MGQGLEIRQWVWWTYSFGSECEWFGIGEWRGKRQWEWEWEWTCGRKYNEWEWYRIESDRAVSSSPFDRNSSYVKRDRNDNRAKASHSSSDIDGHFPIPWFGRLLDSIGSTYISNGTNAYKPAISENRARQSCKIVSWNYGCSDRITVSVIKTKI
jgi:hypothetical protein